MRTPEPKTVPCRTCGKVHRWQDYGDDGTWADPTDGHPHWPVNAVSQADATEVVDLGDMDVFRMAQISQETQTDREKS